MIREVRLEDAEQLSIIYNHYVLNSIVTFDDVPLSKDDFIKKIETIISSSLPFLIFEENNFILGYSYANNWRVKPAYKNTVESTVYVKHNHQGKRIGYNLYLELLERLKSQGIHTVIGGLSLPNTASIKLHENFGFKKVAHFNEVGFKFNKWVDVGFWQLMLNSTRKNL